MMAYSKNSKLIPVPEAPTPMKRLYTRLAGVDFSSISTRVAPFRSPDAKNVWKDYNSEFGQAIETRKGIRLLGTVENVTNTNVYGIHVMEDTAFYHVGTKLFKHTSFGNEFEQTDLTDTGLTMGERQSSSFIYDGKLYIMDGTNYIAYDKGTDTIGQVTGYIPTTRIGTYPDGRTAATDGEISYNPVNLLSDYRRNVFIGNGTATVFTLDVPNYDNESPTAKVEGTTVTVSSYSHTAGTVTLASAPADGASVEITFKKTVSGYADRVKKCTLCRIHDNRVFISGNPDYKGVLFHSMLDDPSYFGDEHWYDDGKDNVAIKAIIPAAHRLVVVKEDIGVGVKVFFHTAAIDSALGKIYPVTESEIYLGAEGGGVNFRDMVVYLSKQGLENVYSTSTYAKIYHKSTLVDTRMTNEPNFSEAKMEVWQNYLCVLINGHLYLADSRQIVPDGEFYREYEWYYWDNVGIYVDGTLNNAKTILSNNDNLYFGTSGGHIAIFDGTCDEAIEDGTVVQRVIDSYWTTPLDIFNNLTLFKTIQKKGGAALIKRIPNSVFKTAVATDKESWTKIEEYRTSGFDFADLLAFLREESTDPISFGTGDKGTVFFNVKRKKIQQFSIKFYSDELNKPFGLYEATIEFTTGKYIKK